MEKEMIDAEKLYDIQLEIRNSIQEATKTFDADKALIQLEILEEEEPLLASLGFGTLVNIFRRDAVLDIMRRCGAGNELMNQLKKLKTISVFKREETFEALRKDVVLDIVKKDYKIYNTGHSMN